MNNTYEQAVQFIDEATKNILVNVGIDPRSMNVDNDQEAAAKIGRALITWLAESQTQSLEMYSVPELEGIGAFLTDIAETINAL